MEQKLHLITTTLYSTAPRLIEYRFTVAITKGLNFMFKLYYFINQKSPVLVYADDNLEPCVKFMQSKNYQPTMCAIVSPNNRKITFSNNKFIVDGVCYSNKNYL